MNSNKTKNHNFVVGLYFLLLTILIIFPFNTMAFDLDAVDEITMQVLEVDDTNIKTIENMVRIPIPVTENPVINNSTTQLAKPTLDNKTNSKLTKPENNSNH